MAGLTDTQITAIIQEVAPQYFVSAVTEGTSWFRMVPQRPSSSPNGPTWRAKSSSAGSAGTFAEAGPYNAPAYQTTTQCQAAGWGKYSASIQISELALKKLQQMVRQNPMGVYSPDGVKTVIDGAAEARKQVEERNRQLNSLAR